MPDKKVLTIQDFSSFGQCSISVALPVVSAAGCETVALPVAVLSTHTSEFKDYTYTDLSDGLVQSALHIKRYNGNFDYIYTGYLGKNKNVIAIEKILSLFPKAKLVVDPAMAEGGQLYDDVDKDYVKNILSLCRKSALCLPNYSEACLLADCEYSPVPDEQSMHALCEKLFDKGISTFAVTGIDEGDTLRVLLGDKGSVEKLRSPKIKGKFYGAGDVFSSVTVGAMANGLDIKQSLLSAIEFTQKAVAETSEDKSHWYGLKFEKFLHLLPDIIRQHDK